MSRTLHGNKTHFYPFWSWLCCSTCSNRWGQDSKAAKASTRSSCYFINFRINRYVNRFETGRRAARCVEECHDSGNSICWQNMALRRNKKVVDECFVLKILSTEYSHGRPLNSRLSYPSCYVHAPTPSYIALTDQGLTPPSCTDK